MKILVLNCGSSSVKYRLFDLWASGAESAETVLARGVVEEVGLGSPRHTHRKSGTEKLVRADLQIRDHRDAIEVVLAILVDAEFGILGSVHELDAVGHRVVHGGEKFSSSVRIGDDVLRAL